MLARDAEAWRIVDEALDMGYTITGADPKKSKARINSTFRGRQLQCFNFVLMAMKTKTLIEDAKKQYDAGNSIVIQIDSTYDAFMDRLLRNVKAGTDLRDVVISPVEDLIRFVQEVFPVIKKEKVRVKKADGSFYEEERVVTDDGKPVISKEATSLRDKLIARLRRIKFNQSPIDDIIN